MHYLVIKTGELARPSLKLFHWLLLRLKIEPIESIIFRMIIPESLH